MLLPIAHGSDVSVDTYPSTASVKTRRTLVPFKLYGPFLVLSAVTVSGFLVYTGLWAPHFTAISTPFKANAAYTTLSIATVVVSAEMPTSTIAAGATPSTSIIPLASASTSIIPLASAYPPPSKVHLLLNRQSQTLEQASARYSLRSGRSPPPGFSQFFEFARERHCLIDEYDNIERDFSVFYQLAENDPNFFKNMVAKGMLVGQDPNARLTTYNVDNEGPHRTHDHYSPFGGDWEDALRLVSKVVPNMSVLFNYQDEPRVVFDIQKPGAERSALNATDTHAFLNKPKSTLSYFTSGVGRHECVLPTDPSGKSFWEPLNNVNAFLIKSASSGFTTDMYPVLSQTKIGACFADILVPSPYYYTRSWWSGKYDRPDDVEWDKKTGKLYWRGGTSGGMIVGQNYHNFPRFRFVDMARNRTDIMDAAFTVLAEPNCKEGCPGDEIKETYNIRKKTDRHDAYRYKYLFDIDGNSFSGRYLGLLRTNSLVFKSTIFTEYFDQWLKPFEHYIPVLPDLSDLEEKVEWAIAHDEEAHRIQQAGREFATRILTDDQNDCYYYLVLLEYARLQHHAGSIALKRGWWNPVLAQDKA